MIRVRTAGGPWRRKAALALIACTLLTVVGLARTAWFPHQEPPDPEASAILDRLQAHKTELAKNNRTYLAGVVEDAGRLVETNGSAARWGTYALARVWQQGWQFTGATWDMGKFAEAERLTRQALQAGPSPEALLARAILTGAACRLLPDSYEGRAEYCRESAERSGESFRRIDEGWLLLEARWNAVLVEGLDPRDTLRSRGLAAQNCEAARELLDESPINGVELAEDCILVASRAGDMSDWMWWARFLLEHGEDAGKDHAVALGHVFRSAHPACTIRDAARLDQPLRAGADDALAYCAFMTELALGCPERAARHVCSTTNVSDCPLPPPSGGVPWDLARLVRDQASRGFADDSDSCERWQ